MGEGRGEERRGKERRAEESRGVDTAYGQHTRLRGCTVYY